MYVLYGVCVCPGLEPFCQEPAVLKKFETMASGRILLAEILVRGQTPLVVLYDTSQDDDVNINAACMKALQDKTLASPLQVCDNCVHLCMCVCVRVYCTLISHHWLSSGEQRLYERNHQQRLLRWDHLLPAALQRPCQAE